MAETIVETASGKVRGAVTGGIYAFKGIPYGAPTGGHNRFRPPQPVVPWSGVKEANHYGQSCWQPLDVTPQTFALMGTAGIDQMGEDCLVLNVWTPGLNDGGKRPVMVWLHGGGFFCGSGNHLPFWDGTALARNEDVVLVSINHRLGIFGHLFLDGVVGAEYAGSGNAGMLDIVQALEWIRDNITVFGGDSGNVTIFGESGGGAKVTTLLAMPSARGLIHRAISESGPGMRERTAEDAAQVARQFLEMRPDMIYAGWAAIPPTIGMPLNHFAPVVDGKVLPVQPFDPIAAPSAANVPLMIGTNKDEMTFMLMKQPELRKLNEEQLRKVLIERIGDKAGSITVPVENIDILLETYRRTRPFTTPYDRLVAILSDRMRLSAIRVAERKAAGGPAPVYMYLFTWESPFEEGKLKSCHTLEMPFVFHNVEPPAGLIGHGPERFILAAALSATWAAFARNGNPDHEGIPHWPAYTSEKRATIILNTQCRIEEDPQSEERRAWDAIC
jgi:para-nitrobenzyl esterase